MLFLDSNMSFVDEERWTKATLEEGDNNSIKIHQNSI